MRWYLHTQVEIHKESAVEVKPVNSVGKWQAKQQRSFKKTNTTDICINTLKKLNQSLTKESTHQMISESQMCWSTIQETETNQQKACKKVKNSKEPRHGTRMKSRGARAWTDWVPSQPMTTRSQIKSGKFRAITGFLERERGTFICGEAEVGDTFSPWRVQEWWREFREWVSTKKALKGSNSND